MSNVILYMSMSLDGFIAGPNESVQNGLGDGGERLHDWFLGGEAVPDALAEIGAALRAANRTIFDEMMATGAVVTGRGTFEAAHEWGGDHHHGVPIFVLQRSTPAGGPGRMPLVTYVPDIADAVARAKHAAGGKDVMMHGVTAARLALEAGVLDEMEIHVVPVLLTEGRRLFDGLAPGTVELERVRVLEGDDGMVHLRYRVR